MSDINNRGVGSTPVAGTPTSAQAESRVVSIDCAQYAKEFEPRGYARVCVVPMMDDPLAVDDTPAEERAELPEGYPKRTKSGY